MAEPDKKRKKYSGNFCVVPGCSNQSGTDKVLELKRSYYHFPLKDAKRLKQWVAAIPRVKWTPSKYSRICSEHFFGGKKTDTPGSDGYIPTIFSSANEARGKTPLKKRTTNTAAKAGHLFKTPELPKKVKKRRVSCSEHTAKPGRPKLYKPADDPQEYRDAVWNSDHDYVKLRQDTTQMTDDQREIMMLKQDIETAKDDMEKVQNRIISLDTVKNFKKWTNLPNREVFDALVEYLKTRGDNLQYWKGQQTNVNPVQFVNKPGPPRKISFEDEFFFVLVKLKTGINNNLLSDLMGLSEAYLSNTFTTWINFLAVELKTLFEMPDIDAENIADCFRPYDSLKVVLDCTELQIERSSTLQARKETWSNYKQRDTVKFMVGLSPNLTVNYVSSAWGGRASDKLITKEAADLVENLNEGDVIMADRGFGLTEELQANGVKLIIPDFKGQGRSQMKRSECFGSYTIATARIHVERIIQRIRTFHILDKTVRLNMKDITEQIFTVCAYLTNFQLPIIRSK